MAISSAGIGSGLDVQSLVAQLVSAERAPMQNRLDLREVKTQSTLSALGVFKSALSSFQTALNALTGTGSALGRLTTSSSKPELFTATTSTGAVAGSFGVEVMQLAVAGKIATSAYASADAVVGNGTVTLSAGADSFTVTLTDGDNTLADLRDKINAASDNSGVIAAILNESGGARLVLTSRETGVSNAVSLSSAATVGGGSFITTSVINTALDAQVEIDGFSYTSASNTIDAAVDGVRIQLLKAEVGSVGTLSLSQDSAAAASAVENLVKSYNALLGVVAQQTRFDPATKSAGPLIGDPAVRASMQQIRGLLGASTDSGTYRVLADLGIKTAKDGTLTLDSSKLSAALQADPTAVKNLFEGSQGVITRLKPVLEGMLGSGGRLEAGTDSLKARLEDIADRREALDVRMAAVERRYRAQFTALDTLLGQMQTTSAYLTQQLANLPGSQKS